MSRWCLGVLLSLLMATGVAAHEGEIHESDEEGIVASSQTRQAWVAVQKPHRLGNDRLYVPKSVQRELGIRTTIVPALREDLQLETVGEVIADPDAGGSIRASQSGRVEAIAANGWPVPGQRVTAGETLGYLRPLLTQREQAERRAALAQIDEDLQIAEISAERLKMQAESAGNVANTGNIYYEQAQFEWNALKEKYRLASEALNSRVAMTASVAGVLYEVAAQPGEVVAEGQPLFEIADASHLRVAVRTFDATWVRRLRAATLRADEGNTLELSLRGQEPVAGQQGWRLLFDAVHPLEPTVVNLIPGQVLPIKLQLANDAAVSLAAACIAAVGTASAWVHAAPEIFERRTLPACQFGARTSSTLVAGERVVTQGAALLAEYR